DAHRDPARPRAGTRTALLGARALAPAAVAPAPTIARRGVLVARARRLPYHPRHRGDDRRIRVRARLARSRLPLLIATDDHRSAVHHRHRPTVLGDSISEAYADAVRAPRARRRCC